MVNACHNCMVENLKYDLIRQVINCSCLIFPCAQFLDTSIFLFFNTKILLVKILQNVLQRCSQFLIIPTTQLNGTHVQAYTHMHKYVYVLTMCSIVCILQTPRILLNMKIPIELNTFCVVSNQCSLMIHWSFIN